MHKKNNFFYCQGLQGAAVHRLRFEVDSNVIQTNLTRATNRFISVDTFRRT